jgi:ligand-binding SRPBCC domain-containing protein
MHTLSRSQVVARPLDEVFAFFSNAVNLEALPMPMVMRPGAQIDYQLTLFGVPSRWRTRITDWQPGVRFIDEQESGPYALWRHTHEFEAQGETTIIRDTVEYTEPFGPLGRLAHVLFVKRTLDRVFDYRRDATARLFGSPVAQSPSRC